MSVFRRREKNVGYVELNNPPVNAIGQPMRQGLLDAVRWAETERLDRVIVNGAGRVFAAGADVREFDSVPVEPHLPDVLNAIDKSSVPWIAAINGVALGGGAELALACRMRIMSPGARIGLPEVTLGVIPGAGGTGRLPRLVGLETALRMITDGRALGSDAALAEGLVHGIDDDPAEAAFKINSEELRCIVPIWELPPPDLEPSAFKAARAAVSPRKVGPVAAHRAIDVIEQGLGLSFHDALQIERAAFLELRESVQASALRHIFFAERAAKAPSRLANDQVELDHIAVVGGGTMGAGITYSLLTGGFQVTLLEIDDEGTERARQNVERIISDSTQRGMIDENGAADRRNRLRVTAEYAEVTGADLAIEAAFESMEIKKDIFARLDATLSPQAILATNTSYLDIDEIASVVSNPARVLGLHFFAPAHIMKLLEIVRGETTGDNALAVGFSLAKKLKKVPVLARVCDGFIGNRILARYREAADAVLMEGATPWEIDEAMVRFGYAMGPYETQDLSGLDIAYANRRRQDAQRGSSRRYIPIADRLVELGRLGRKTGAGWYRYSSGGKVKDPTVAELAIEEADSAGIERTDFTSADIVERLVLAMINEAADILSEGIAERARDIDLVTVFGYGFPRWRGGLMHYAETIGASTIIKKINALAERDASAWQASSVLRQCAATGTRLADWRPAA